MADIPEEFLVELRAKIEVIRETLDAQERALKALEDVVQQHKTEAPTVIVNR